MTHKTRAELTHMIELAGRQVAVGGHYYHYKHPETHYVLTGLVILEATNEVAVLYATLDSPVIEFVRPLRSWLDMVDWHGQTVPRFTRMV